MAKRKPSLTRAQKMLRADGALCVTFVNTQRRHPLESYDDLLAWASETGALESRDAERLAGRAIETPAKAAGALKLARTLRGRLHRMLLALTKGEAPAREDVRIFNVQLRRVMAARQIDHTGKRWIWGPADGDDFDRMLWPVVYSAAELLTSEDRQRLRRCHGEPCGLLFVARGGGKPRKWCSTACCNRRSTRVHYHKMIKPTQQRLAREIDHGRSRRRRGINPDWLKTSAPRSQDH